MPFTTQESRADYPDTLNVTELIKLAHRIGQAGDRCFIFYRPMVRQWRAQPRWTTWHNILVTAMNDYPYLCTDDRASLVSALLVLFNRHVAKYEEEKCTQNGDVH